MVLRPPMQAAISNDEGPEALRHRRGRFAGPGPDEIRVKVRATALNRADSAADDGPLPCPAGAPADIPGLEYAGEVVAVGARVHSLERRRSRDGPRGGGAWARAAGHARARGDADARGHVVRRAAAIPEAFATAFDALVLQGGMRSNSEVLIHAVGSGVGTAALQLCQLFGAKSDGHRPQRRRSSRAPRAWGSPRSSRW